MKDRVLVVAILFVLSSTQIDCSTVVENTPARDEPKPAHSVLSDADLEKLIHRPVNWVYKWGGNIISCPEGIPEQMPLFAESLFSTYENKRITALVKRGGTGYRIDLVDIKMHLRFVGVDTADPVPTEVSFFCESPLAKEGGYAEHQIAMPDIVGTVPKQVGADHSLLLEKIVSAATEFVVNSCNTPDTRETNKTRRLSPADSAPRITISIPVFEVGDPAIYVMLNGSKTRDLNDPTILFFRFVRDSQQDEIKVTFVKQFGLPDEIKRYVDLIRTETGKEISLPCPYG